MKRTLSVILAVVMIFTIIPTTFFMSSAAAKCPKGHTYSEHYCKTCKKFETNYTGMAKKDSTWCYVTNGKENTTFTGLAKNDYGWWYMTNGRIDYNYVGLAKNQYGWWYIQNGTINFKYTGMAKNQYGWWYVKNGKLDTTYTGLAKNQYGWFYMKNGKLDSTYTGMAKNQYGWFYVKNGKLDSTFTGIAKNDYGNWYMKNGKLDSTYNGTYTDKNGTKWTVTNGKATKKDSGSVKAVDPAANNFPNPIGTIKKAWMTSGYSGLNIKISRVELNKTITQKFDSTVSSQIVNPKTISYKPACSVAIIECDDPKQLKISTGGGEAKTVEDWAKAVSAVIAVNGTGSRDGYFEDHSAVIRNGSLFKSYTGPNPILTYASYYRLIMYKNGKWENKTVDNATAESVIANGAYNTIRHQGLIIWDGEIVEREKETTAYRNHTYLGQINTKKYVLMTSEFMAIEDCAKVLKAYGCQKAVQVNGGNCSQMYVKGIGNTTGSTGASVKGLNKVGYLETEWFAMKGLLAANKGGGPCTDKLDVIYFK